MSCQKWEEAWDSHCGVSAPVSGVQSWVLEGMVILMKKLHCNGLLLRDCLLLNGSDHLCLMSLMAMKLKIKENEWLMLPNSVLQKGMCSLRGWLNTLSMTTFDCFRKWEKEWTSNVSSPFELEQQGFSNWWQLKLI